jgi:uncharacterized membrane protein
MEHRYRSLLKAASWRLTGTIDTFVISFVITQKVTLALSISGFEIFTKMTLYYFHERIWNRVKFGKKETVSDYQI